MSVYNIGFIFRDKPRNSIPATTPPVASKTFKPAFFSYILYSKTGELTLGPKLDSIEFASACTTWRFAFSHRCISYV